MLFHDEPSPPLTDEPTKEFLDTSGIPNYPLIWGDRSDVSFVGSRHIRQRGRIQAVGDHRYQPQYSVLDAMQDRLGHLKHAEIHGAAESPCHSQNFHLATSAAVK